MIINLTTWLNLIEITSLMDLVTNYFEIEGKFYSEEDGMAMGSSLSLIFAYIFTKDLKEQAIRLPLNNLGFVWDMKMSLLSFGFMTKQNWSLG